MTITDMVLLTCVTGTVLLAAAVTDRGQERPGCSGVQRPP